MKTFRLTTIGSVVGLLLIGILQLTKAAAEQTQWERSQLQQQALEQQAALEQRKVEIAKETAETYQKNQVHFIPSMQLLGYVLSDQPPQGIDWNTFVDRTRKTLVYDQYRACIGFAYAGQFVFIKDNPNACEVK